MKRLIILVVYIMAATWSVAQQQNTYKTDFANNANNTVVIEAAPEMVTIVGHDKNEIIIEADIKSKPLERKPQPPKEPSDREKGLKPLTQVANDNTGIGLTIDKSADKFTIRNVPGQNITGSYTIRIPNKVKLTVNEIMPWNKANYNISSVMGELNINALNSGFVIKDISGPVVMQNTNGDIEIVYSNVSANKPNSLTTVNGFIDITLPSNTKADVKINAINGEAFTDFDIKAEANEEGMPPFHGHQLKVFNLNGKINEGGVPFNISAVNGNVYIRKGK